MLASCEAYFSAAYLCAAGIAVLLNRMKKKYVTVGVDGSVYRFHPNFPRLLDEKISSLLEPSLDVSFFIFSYRACHDFLNPECQ